MAVSRRLRFEILRRDGHTCRYCGAAAPQVALTVDHVIPVALGGSNDPANLATACIDCNSGKSSISPGSPLVGPPTGDPLVDNWYSVMGYIGRHGQPVGIAEDVLTVRAERGYTPDIRGAATAALGQWSQLVGIPLRSVVVEQGPITPLPIPPPPTKRDEARRFPLDPGWDDSVSRFVSLGLTMDDLERFTEISMRKQGLEPHERFRYFCGCCWRRITDLQESARRILESEDADGQS